MPKRKKQSDAYKKLRAAVRKGPKRVKISRPRRSTHQDPLTKPENVKRVQICLQYGMDERTLVVVMFKQAFSELGFVQHKIYNMERNRLTRGVKLFKKIYEKAPSVDFTRKKFKEIKLGYGVGRCLIFFGSSIENPDATINIQKTKEEQQRAEKVKAYVASLFEQYSFAN